jgi:hypothetical protein
LDSAAVRAIVSDVLVLWNKVHTKIKALEIRFQGQKPTEHFKPLKKSPFHVWQAEENQ